MSERLTCDQCGNNVDIGYYDDWKEHYYCDYSCFERWAEDNYDAILDYYEQMNLT